jgi:sulfite oxidase
MPPFGKHPETLVRQEEPFNAGPPPSRLAASSITAVEDFFVRNHGEVPAVDPATWRLRVEGEVERPLELSLADLAARPRRQLIATVQCAGNRRQELIEHRPVPHELPWGAEAISTASWAGPALAELLAEARPTATAAHVEFTGLDETERRGRRFAYGGSIPLAKALAPETLLALEMNGAPLPPVHGFPVRALVPGWIGARSVKWLARIEVRRAPSENYFQAVAYRLFPAGVGPENVVWEEGAMLGEQPVTTIVTSPEPRARIRAGRVAVDGIAYVGGPRTISRVEVSTDGGATWTVARLGEDAGPWAWRMWRAEVDLAAGAREIVARAFDSAGQTQPSEVGQIWNFKGYMNNAWARVAIDATPA